MRQLGGLVWTVLGRELLWLVLGGTQRPFWSGPGLLYSAQTQKEVTQSSLRAVTIFIPVTLCPCPGPESARFPTDLEKVLWKGVTRGLPGWSSD